MENYEITKEQILELSAYGIKPLLKKWFPEALVEELEEGKWYKHINCTSIQFNKKDGIGYGINAFGSWVEGAEWIAREDKYLWIEATESEVKEALEKEAKKRGYKNGVIVHSFVHDTQLEIKEEDNVSYIADYNKLHFGVNGTKCIVIFKDGVWAEIIPQKAKQITMEKAIKILSKKFKQEVIIK